MLCSHVRVLVVAVVVLALAVSLAPAAQARPLHAGPPAVKADSGWLHAAATWLTRLVTRGPKKPIPPPTYGSCIDPWGREVLCS